MGECKSAEENGVYVLHGNRQAFYAEEKDWTTEPAFKAVYSAFEEANLYLKKLHFVATKIVFILMQFDFGSDLEELLTNARRKVVQTLETSCGKMSNYFMKGLEAQIRQM